MRDSVEYQFPCSCGEDVLVELEVTSWGHPGTSASWYYPGDPPEGAEWAVVKPETCACGKVWDDDTVLAEREDKVQEYLAHYHEDRYDD
jgi:hypothetical protein